MIVTITGANSLLARAELDRLTTEFAAEHGDMAIERYDGEETGTERMVESTMSMPFLSARKLVILREPGKQKAFAEAIASVLSDVADSTDLIIYEPKLDKRGSYYKTLKSKTDFREYTELDAGSLSKWAVDFVRECGGSIRPADAQLLIDRVGINQQVLRSELTKLLHYSPEITRETIKLLTERQPQSTVFELLDAAFAGKTQRAFELYREQRALRVEPQAILAMLAWQLHVLAVVSTGGKRSADEIAKVSRLNPYVVRKSQGIARRLTPVRIKQMVAGLLELDMQLKRTAIDADEALQLYLLKLASI